MGKKKYLSYGILEVVNMADNIENVHGIAKMAETLQSLRLVKRLHRPSFGEGCYTVEIILMDGDRTLDSIYIDKEDFGGDL